MTIRFWDSLARRVVDFEQRYPGRASIYVCGPTVYNYVHVGNGRTFAWFDLIRRYLSYRGYEVTFVMNYTDVDDKIIERANLEKLSVDAVSSKYSDAFERDMRALGVQPPDVLCRATEHIDDMAKAIQGLIERGIAYEVDGDVFFAVDRFPSYGKLSGRSLDDMRAGERVEPHPGKRHPLDFALWKAAKEGEPSWPSPWGPGRPGWHIECSVMSTRYLGMGFDLHGGASDLIFPHHENEIAQAEALEEREPFVRHWLHAGLVQMEAEKMSKSLGNIVLASEAIERYGGEVVRYWMLSGAPRTQVTFSEDALNDAQQGYERWKQFMFGARHALGESMPAVIEAPRRPMGGPPPEGPAAQFLERFVAALDDDFNSPEAYAVVHDLVREGNRCLEGAQAGDEADRGALSVLVSAFLELTAVLGFELPEQRADAALSEEIDRLVEEREQARRDKAFDRADEIRKQLAGMGVTIEDTSAGPRWRLGV